MKETNQKATFAGGCFWCIEHAFTDLPGVISATSGYAGGKKEDARYLKVATRTTAHKEAVQIVFDPNIISYGALLDVFWKNIDPTDAEGQFADRGPEYETAIMYHNENQKQEAEASKKTLEGMHVFEKPIVTKIIPLTTFFEAEPEHQGYAKRCPIRYNMYKKGSGRSAFLKKTWT